MTNNSRVEIGEVLLTALLDKCLLIEKTSIWAIPKIEVNVLGKYNPKRREHCEKMKLYWLELSETTEWSYRF